MFDRLATTLSRRPRRVLLLTLLFIAVSGVFGGPVAGLLSTGDDFGDPDSESAVATERLERAAGAGTDPGIVVLVSAGAPVEAPVARAKIEAVSRILAGDPDVARTVSFLTTRDRAFVSRDGRATYVLAYVRAGAEDEEVGGL
jgi:RND superfamily putative drug exporter